jgi:hypothetical protein
MAPTGGFPHIPDEWNRENSKVSVKHVRSKQNQDTAAPGPTNAPAAPAPVPPGKGKRKRAKPVDTDRVEDTIDPPDLAERVSEPLSGAEDGNVVEPTPVPTLESMQEPTRGENPHPPGNTDTTTRCCDETESVMRGLYNQVEKLSRRPGCALTEGIYLDSIMTHIPYVDVLVQMFGGDSATIKPCVPLVTRAYEESYMREVVGGGDEPCIMGNSCECQFVDEHNPFVGVQFTLPIAIFPPTADTETSHGPKEASTQGLEHELSVNTMCVLCCRKNTQSLFYDALYNHRAYNGCIQLYGNICDRPGEYAKEAMLICPLSGPINNMPLPVVSHQRNRYSVVVYNGVRQLKQHRVGFEDFHAPSSSRC